MVLNSIRFSHKYVKFPFRLKDQDRVTLLEVIRTKYEDLHKSFIEYDTRTIKGDYYKLPESGDALLLIFVGEGLDFDRGELFTTIRDWTKSKEEYYKSLRGKEIKVRILEQKKN